MDYITENFKGTSRNLPLDKLPIDFARNQDDRVTIRHLVTHDSNLVMDIKNYTSKIEVDKLKHMPLEKGLADIIHDVKSIPAWRLLNEKLSKLYAPLKFEIKKWIILDPIQVRELVKSSNLKDTDDTKLMLIKTPFYLSEDVSAIIAEHFESLCLVPMKLKLKNAEGKLPENIYEIAENEIYPKLLKVDKTDLMIDSQSKIARFVSVGRNEQDLQTEWEGKQLCINLNTKSFYVNSTIVLTWINSLKSILFYNSPTIIKDTVMFITIGFLLFSSYKL